jgi:hypothetical protein
MENQLSRISVQGLLKLRNCADRLIAKKIREQKASLREELPSFRYMELGALLQEGPA